MQKHDWSRWQGWRGRVTYWKGFAAWQIYRVVPIGLLLPTAGDYCFWDDAMIVMSEDLAQ